MSQKAVSVIAVPQSFTVEWVRQHVQTALDASTRAGGVQALKEALPQAVCIDVLTRLEQLLKAEPTLIEIQPPSNTATVTVVGDTHGQFHDVCRLLEVAGYPSADSLFVFNGDVVDRGAWGLETLVLLACLKLALPQQVFLLRGNHETATCTLMYGFKQELVAKYGRSVWRPVYAACKRLFAALPLAALIARRTLVLHGGLFRAPLQRTGAGRNKRKRAQPRGSDTTLGSLDDLRRAGKGGMDPNGLGQSRLATDVLWSDPVMEPGLQLNDARGVGLIFGPDVTERFLKANGLALILRSHEGPDAREGRDDMSHMLEGYTLDHETNSGKLMTVFSAPDYPQFIPEAAERYKNKAAVAVLSAPSYSTPEMRVFEAVQPRPEATPFYDVAVVVDSDEEFEPAPSTASGMTDVQRDQHEELADDGTSSGELAAKAAEAPAWAGLAADTEDARALAAHSPADAELGGGEGALAAAAAAADPSGGGEPAPCADAGPASAAAADLAGSNSNDSGNKENSGCRSVTEKAAIDSIAAEPPKRPVRCAAVTAAV